MKKKKNLLIMCEIGIAIFVVLVIFDPPSRIDSVIAILALAGTMYAINKSAKFS